MGTARSTIAYRDDEGKMQTKEGGFTFSQIQKAKLLGKEPKDLTKAENQKSIKIFKAEIAAKRKAARY